MALNIGELVGYVRLDTKGVDTGAARTKSVMGGLGSTIKGALATAGVVGAAAGIKSAIGLEAQYSKTMAQIAASTGAPKAEMAKMGDLAKQLGADTQFSAGEASGAMLELAKAGISTSDIMGGALQGTLTLAAAGGTDLATASTIASNAMNTFNMTGKDMDKIAAALAGGANASSASVESLGQALQQVGPGATNAGMTLQETVGALSAFDAAGIKGADAGTSLKTMLTALVPSTDKAKTAMEKYGLSFVNADGSFKSMTEIAGQLHSKLGHLSEAQKTQALRTIFGSDASRAATVLMNEGAKGIGKYIKATKDQDAAQKMAAANMSGTAGVLERMQGSIETAGLALGTLLAPVVALVATGVGAMADSVGKATGFLSEHKGVAITLAVVIGVLAAATAAHAAVMAVSAAGGMSAWLKQTKLISAATRVWAAVQWVFNAAMMANPLALVVVGLVALGAALYLAWSKSSKFREIVTGAFDKVKGAAKAVGHWFTSTLPGFFADAWNGAKNKVTSIGGKVLDWFQAMPGKARDKLSSLTGKVRDLFHNAMQAGKDKVTGIGGSIVDWVQGIPDRFLNNLGRFKNAGRDLLQSFVDGMKNAAGVIGGIAGNVWNAVRGLLNGAIDRINSALVFTIKLPGPDLSINPPNIPHLATGGRATAATLAVIGEGREPETVLPDSVLRGLLERVHAAGAAMARGGGGPLIGQVVQQPGESSDELAERLWFKTRTRG